MIYHCAVIIIMNYLYKAGTIVGKADDIIVRYASGVYDEQGTSMYDLIRVTERDKDLLAQYAGNAMVSLLVRLANIYQDKHTYYQWNNGIAEVKDILTRKRTITTGDTPYDVDYRYIEDTVLTIRPHATDPDKIVAVYPPQTEGGESTEYEYTFQGVMAVEHVFYVPDFDEEKHHDDLCYEIDQYLAYAVAARWLADKYPSGEQQHADSAADCMNKAINLIYTRKRVCR